MRSLIVLPRHLHDVLRVVQDRVPRVLAHVVRPTVSWKIDRHNLKALLRGRVEHGISADGRTHAGERGGGRTTTVVEKRAKTSIHEDAYGEKARGFPSQRYGTRARGDPRPRPGGLHMNVLEGDRPTRPLLERYVGTTDVSPSNLPTDLILDGELHGHSCCS